jgi:hypothetical protein
MLPFWGQEWQRSKTLSPAQGVDPAGIAEIAQVSQFGPDA